MDDRHFQPKNKDPPIQGNELSISWTLWTNSGFRMLLSAAVSPDVLYTTWTFCRRGERHRARISHKEDRHHSALWNESLALNRDQRERDRPTPPGGLGGGLGGVVCRRLPFREPCENQRVLCPAVGGSLSGLMVFKCLKDLLSPLVSDCADPFLSQRCWLGSLGRVRTSGSLEVRDGTDFKENVFNFYICALTYV